jgi:hypothetical protein
MSLRSYIETIACMDIIERQKYLTTEKFAPVRQAGRKLFFKLRAFRRSISARPPSLLPGRIQEE